MPVVWLVRHGESQSIVEEPTFSTKDTTLTETGHEQAREIVQALFFRSHSRKPSLIVTSEYKRAQQTAHPTEEAFPRTPKEVWPVREFTYLSEKKTLWTTRQERRQFVQEYWDNNDPTYIDGEGAESFIQFIARVYDAIERLTYINEEFITVFTHGIFMQAVLWILLTVPMQINFKSKSAFWHFCQEHPIPTGSIQEIKFGGRDDIHVGKLIVDHLGISNLSVR